MKNYIFPAILLSLPLFAQTSLKSIEPPTSTVMTNDQKVRAEVRQEQQAREAWDREEADARQKAEFRREMDEARAKEP